jgi:hypothetical protein
VIHAAVLPGKLPRDLHRIFIQGFLPQEGPATGIALRLVVKWFVSWTALVPENATPRIASSKVLSLKARWRTIS